MERQSPDEVFFHVARAVAARATCPRKQVGAVAVMDGQILATGYNGAPRGAPHCTDRELHDDHMALDHCPWAIHAETNLIAQAARHGVSLKGATVYSTLEPCESCEGIMANAGIEHVKYLEEYARAHPGGVHDPTMLTPIIDE